MVAALSRGLSLLAAFRAERPLLTNAELSRLCKLPKSSVSRLTHTLVKLGYLEYDSGHGAYRLGPKVLSLSYAVSGSMLLRDLVSPYMKVLAEASRSNVALAILEEYSMLLIEVVNASDSRVRPMIVGSHMTLDSTAMGRAYVASCSSTERERILTHLVTDRGRDPVTLRTTFDQALRDYRSQGYCTSVNAWRAGVTGVAVPLVLKSVGRRVVLTCGGLESSMPEDTIHQRIAPLLLESAASIEKASRSLKRF